jgi:RNA polymerase sigma factor (sigma-70 family)
MKSASTKKELFDRYVLPNMDYCRSVTLRYLATGMELNEIFSAVQTKLYESMPYYDPNKPLKTFLHVCIKNYTYNLIKSRQRGNNCIVRLDDISRQLSEESLNTTFKASDFRDTGKFAFSDTTYKAIMALKPIDRKIFLLHYIDGDTLQEISETTGINAANIKQILFQSMEIVRYKVTGCKPLHTSAHSYMRKAKSLNNVDKMI